MEIRQKRIGVLMGGWSAEREVSLKTGKAIEEALRSQDFNVMGIDVDREIARRLSDLKIEIAYIALHGRFGEDGTIQGLLEMMGIPYTGSGVLASALAINKIMTKYIFEHHYLPTPEFLTVKRSSLQNQGEKGALIEGAAAERLGFPLVVKPCREGSTIGVSIVKKAEELKGALEEAGRYDEDILLERYIPGKDITVGILDEEALPIVEIIPPEGFYNYRAKYTPGMTKYVVPAELPPRIYEEVQRLALFAHRALGCRAISRVDLRVDPEGKPYLLEVNTIPGMTPTSLLPKAAQQAGISFDELVVRILRYTLNED